MLNLNDQELLQKLDPQNTRESTDLLIKQCRAAWDEVYKLDLPDWGEFRPKNIVFCGMGASIYGALVLKSLLWREIGIPLDIVSDYEIPSYVNHESLVVLTSYSGNTEETVSCAGQALAQGAKILVITKGGLLAKFADEHSLPHYVFDGKLNTAGIPRLGNGYTIIGLLAFLNRLNYISIEDTVMQEALQRLSEKQDEIRNSALAMLEAVENKIPVIIAAEHLSGNAQILRNQFNETSKTFSSFFLIPDLNHHLMEGLKFPEKNPLVFLSLYSENYSDSIRKRFTLTSEVIEKNGFTSLVFSTSAQTVYDDFLECMLFGSYLTLYLGLSYGQNPAINPYVDHFKKALEEK